MSGAKQQIKQLLFRAIGKDPEAVVLSFATGEPAEVLAMVEEVRRLIPDRRHFLAGFEDMPACEGVTPLRLKRGRAFSIWVQLRRAMRRYRIGMAPVLIEGRHRSLIQAAYACAPGKILAYNRRMERHHLQWRQPLSSLLFWWGLPLDEIHQRPRWLAWTTADRTVVPDDAQRLHGRHPRVGAPRIAVLTPFLPYPLSHGGAVRLFYLLREMAREFDVYLFAFRENEAIGQLGPLLDFCTEVGVVSKPRFREPRWSALSPPEVCEYESEPMRRLLARVSGEERIELVQVEYTQLARYQGDILVEHDVTYDLYEQIYRRQPSTRAWWDVWRWKRFERKAVRRYRRVVVMSEKDRRLLATPHARVIGNGVDLDRFQPSPEQPGQNLLFIGSFRHFPNVTAFRFLREQVWPLLRDRFPSLRITVIAGPDAALHFRSATGMASIPEDARIAVHGFIADVRPFYEAANVVLVPTLVSAGTNVKVLEAMAMERAIVSTPSGVGGIPVVHGRHVLIASDAAEFAQSIGVLLGDPAMRRTLAAESRRMVEEQFDWIKLGEMQRLLIRELLPVHLRLRPGTMADVERVRQIQHAALPSSKWDAEHYLRHEFHVALWDEEVAGFIVARQTAPDEREILNIAVAPEFRGRGIGESLLRLLMKRFGSCEVFLEVRESNEAARRLYRRVGFVDVGRRPNYYEDPPETAVIMRRGHSFQNNSASERRM